MYKNKQVAGGAMIAGFLAVFAFLGPVSPFINTASAGYGGNGGSSKATICHKGKTIKVAQSAVAAHIKHGDTKGACLAVAQVLGESTSASKQEQIAALQVKLIALLQQLFASLKA